MLNLDAVVMVDTMSIAQTWKVTEVSNEIKKTYKMSFFHSRLLTHSESLRKNTTVIHIFGTNTFHISKKTKTNDISRTKSMYVCVMCVFCISNWTLFDFFLVIRKNLRHVFFCLFSHHYYQRQQQQKHPLRWNFERWLDDYDDDDDDDG